MGYPQYPGYGHSIQVQPIQGQPLYGQPYGSPQGNAQLPPAYLSTLNTSPQK